MNHRSNYPKQTAGQETEDTYSEIKRCNNCKAPIIVVVPKGKTIDGFLGGKEGQAIVCDNCGCQAFPERC